MTGIEASLNLCLWCGQWRFIHRLWYRHNSVTVTEKTRLWSMWRLLGNTVSTKRKDTCQSTIGGTFSFLSLPFLYCTCAAVPYCGVRTACSTCVWFSSDPGHERKTRSDVHRFEISTINKMEEFPEMFHKLIVCHSFCNSSLKYLCAIIPELVVCSSSACRRRFCSQCN